MAFKMYGGALHPPEVRNLEPYDFHTSDPLVWAETSLGWNRIPPNGK